MDSNYYIKEECEFLELLVREKIPKNCEINSDRELDTVINLYRAKFFSQIHKSSNNIWKSPELNQVIKINGNKIDRFSYERNMELNYLESYIDKKKLNEVSSIITSSGMSSIYLTLITISSIYNDQLNCYRFSDYFETRMLGKVLSNTNIEYKDISYLYSDSLKNMNIVFIEPVSYTWSFPTFNFNKLLSLVSENSDKQFVIVIDSTLIGDLNNYKYIIELFEKCSNIFIVEIRSLLKMDQFGLEFTNGGLIQCYKNMNNLTFDNISISKYMKELRTILGYGLSYESYLILSNNMIKENLVNNEYSNQVLNNNYNTFKNLKNNKLFKNINYPTSSLKSPFIIFELNESSKENYLFLSSLIYHLSNKEDISLYYGSSFGFRHHRFEIIIPNEKSKNIIFKLAVGYRRDKSYEKIIQLFNKISEYSISELKEIYSNIKSIGLDIE